MLGIHAKKFGEKYRHMQVIARYQSEPSVVKIKNRENKAPPHGIDEIEPIWSAKGGKTPSLFVVSQGTCENYTARDISVHAYVIRRCAPMENSREVSKINTFETKKKLSHVWLVPSLLQNECACLHGSKRKTFLVQASAAIYCPK